MLLRFLALIVLALFAIPASADEAQRPNIVLIIADDMAWNDCSVYGHPNIKTPHLSLLASQGMRFDNAYLTCSSCSPSRSSIITGRYPHSTGGAHQLHNELPADQLTFVELLRESGYHTALAGKLHPRKTTETRFDLIYGTGPKESGGAGEWVKAIEEAPKDKPFFLWLASFDPHRGYQPNTIPEPHTSSDVIVPPYLPDVPEVREDLALYYDEISRLDHYVGKVMTALEKLKQADNTLIIFISDNGRPFPRCKTTIYNSGVKTPFIARWPGQIKPGSTCEQLVSTVDLAPSFCKAAGVEVSETFQGVSILPLFKDPTVPVREYIFAEHNWHDYDDHQRSCHSLYFNYIRTEYTDIPQMPPADAVKSVTFQKMRELHAKHELNEHQDFAFETPRPGEELYDVLNDPHELNNLADDPKYQGQLEKHRERLNQWVEETADEVPTERRPDEFDRETGDRLPRNKQG
ncbi:sulfatase family protein [Rubinisphaera margarita]|uniref:sulfatase family protein n=1 Tax=Rubinisphaera margarita TaxID=2909586 RepID=UPI001EE7EC88|nr:sulfatase [Rubinisphaera margarita]MCG6156759.1 sulfatase [Rubinisphaera margarita]